MRISVWDTYVQRENGSRMHFDILVPTDLKDPATIFGFGQEYLKSKSFKTGSLTANECRFCHMEQATEDIVASVEENGYAILEMENCN